MKNMIFREWAAIWLEQKRHLVKESTYANYSVAMVNHILPRLGERLLKDIDESIVKDIVSELLENGRLDFSGGLSIKTVKDISAILMMCLRDAKQYGNHYNWRIIYPHEDGNSDHIQIISIEVINRILEIINENCIPEYVGYAVGIYTGMRIGEICALRWEDINMKEKYIIINKTLQRVYNKDLNGNGHSKVIIASPKSKKSKRLVPINKSLYELLKHIESNKKFYLITGKDKYMEPRLYRNHFKKFIQKNNFPNIHFHMFRHTFATRCITAGTDYKTVSELLGHSSVNLTMSLYVHSQLEEKRKCVEALEKIYENL